MAIPKLKNNWINSIEGAYEKIKGKENEDKRIRTRATIDVLSLCRETERELEQCMKKVNSI